MSLTVRRLVKNGKNQRTTTASGVTGTKPPRSSTDVVDMPVVVRGRSTDVEQVSKVVEQERAANTEELVKAQKERPVGMEVADGPGGGGVGNSMIRGRNPYGSILEGFVHTDIESNNAQQMGKNKDVTIHKLFRDMYYHDPICGSAVDLMSNMPFSDFSLAGAKDKKVYQKFEDSIHNMNIKPLLPLLSNEYLVHGLFVATTMFDQNEGVFNGIIPQQIDYVEVTPVPIFGRDPLIDLRVGEAFKDLTTSDDPRMQEYKSLMTPSQDTLRPKPEDVIYIPRRALLRDFRGVSIFRRILSAWLLERSLYRGTLDQAMKRQRAVTHLMAGDNEWTPTAEQLGELADNLVAADMDPVGAIFVTRTGVTVSEVRSSGELWKVTDLTDFFTQAKLRSLGISESFISGDASYNSLEQAMSVFIEQMRGYREMMSYELFYDRTFPRIAKANEYARRRYALEKANEYDPNQIDMFPDQSPLMTKLGYYNERASTAMTREERNNLFIPQVHWHKRLRPEADQEYLGMLATLQENNIPIPLRIWAAAGGLDLDNLMNQKDDDIQLRKDIKDWMKVVKPPEMGEGGEGMGGGAPDALDLSFVTANTKRRMGLLSRFDDVDPDTYGVKNMAGGKRHILSRKGAKVLDERMNRQIAEVAANVAKRVNDMETRMEERFQELNSTIKYYHGK